MTRALAKRRKPAAPGDGPTRIAVFPGDGPDAPPVTGLAKTTTRGELRSMLVHVPLSEERKELWEFRGELIPTAVGMLKANRFLGMSFINPETVAGEDGSRHPNPFYRRAPDGRLLSVRIRKVGFWKNPLGNPQVYDYTLDFDLGVYLAEALFAKWTGKKKPPSPMAWGRLAAEPDKEPGEQAYLLGSGDYLIVKLNQPEVIQVIGEHNNLDKFADRRVDTMCVRNLLRKAIAVAKVGPDGTIPIVSWQTSGLEYAELRAAAEQVNTGQFDGALAGAQVTTATEVVDDPDDMQDVIDADLDQADNPASRVMDAPEPSGIAPTANAAPPNAELQKLRAELRTLHATLGADSADKFLGEVGVEGLQEVSISADLPLLTAARDRLAAARQARLKADKAKSDTAQSKTPETLPLAGDHNE